MDLLACLLTYFHNDYQITSNLTTCAQIKQLACENITTMLFMNCVEYKLAFAA